MNYKRILLGGLVAGVIINASEFVLNGVVFAKQMQADLTRHNLVMASWAMPAYVIMAFCFGLFLAWIYAAIRPRFGPGLGTAVVAAAVVWGVGYVLPTIGLLAIGMGDATTYVIALIWGAAELVLAGIVAAYLYREGESPAATRAAAV